MYSALLLSLVESKSDNAPTAFSSHAQTPPLPSQHPALATCSTAYVVLEAIWDASQLDHFSN